MNVSMLRNPSVHSAMDGSQHFGELRHYGCTLPPRLPPRTLRERESDRETLPKKIIYHYQYRAYYWGSACLRFLLNHLLTSIKQARRNAITR